MVEQTEESKASPDDTAVQQVNNTGGKAAKTKPPPDFPLPTQKEKQMARLLAIKKALQEQESERPASPASDNEDAYFDEEASN